MEDDDNVAARPMAAVSLSALFVSMLVVTLLS